MNRDLSSRSLPDLRVADIAMMATTLRAQYAIVCVIHHKHATGVISDACGIANYFHTAYGCKSISSFFTRFQRAEVGFCVHIENMFWIFIIYIYCVNTCFKYFTVHIFFSFLLFSFCSVIARLLLYDMNNLFLSIRAKFKFTKYKSYFL